MRTEYAAFPAYFAYYKELTKCAESTAIHEPDIAFPASEANNKSGPVKSSKTPKRRLGMRERSLSPCST
jgi:hypothetical protein